MTIIHTVHFKDYFDAIIFKNISKMNYEAQLDSSKINGYPVNSEYFFGACSSSVLSIISVWCGNNVTLLQSS